MCMCDHGRVGHCHEHSGVAGGADEPVDILGKYQQFHQLDDPYQATK